MKFEWNHQEVIIHGDGSNPIYTNQTIPFVKNRRKLGGETFHRIEHVNAIEKYKWRSSKIESILAWAGYEPDRGLGKNLQGITKPIQLKCHDTTFGLGYQYTWQEYNDWSPPWRGSYYPLEQPVPHLSQSFHQTDMMWGSEEDEVLAGLRNLFLEDEDMDCSAIVEVEEEEEEEEGLVIQTVEKGVVLRNWTATPSQDNDSEDLEEDIILEEIIREVKNFENKPNSNLDETQTVNLGDSETVKETHVSIPLSPSDKEDYVRFLKEYEDIFSWFYDDMTGLSTSIMTHKLPTNPMCLLVKQKLRKFKSDMSLKIKEEVTKQIKAMVLRVVEYPTWLANIVLVPKKNGKVRIWMNEEVAKKTAFITPWGVYCYKMMSFGLNNAAATYMRAMTTVFHDMIHNEIEVYVDDVIIKSKRTTNHIADLRKFFDRLRRHNLKLNPAKCAFEVLAGKLLGFIVSRGGIELDPSKVKAIQDFPPPKNKKDVMSFLGRLNYISRFIAQLTMISEPIFKILKKDAATSWTEECQKAFDKIKEYLSKPPVLVPPEPGRPLLLY
ncbi:uncharacterized protein [Nicotiana tomentosiformis]|uniref:uncharacterized protein n=1 Tax=Nicotiana tomentosiformis TaxID=4098 RepID=UPI00388C9380